MAERSSSSRKRSYFEGVDDLDLENPHKSTEKKKVRFPKGKKQKPGDEAVDPSSHAEEEASESEEAKLVSRARELRRNRNFVEGTEMLHDISVAEKHYEDNEPFIDDGIQVEPFNLDQEREEGYFDQSGNYVEYINKEIKDAWLDSVEVDPKLADNVFVEKIDDHGNAELSASEIGMMKRRMADVLEPGETVLGALRRLKGTSSSKKEKMSAETKLIFDQLTEDAMKLMENGDYNVYEEKQEVFQREAEGYERLAQARAGGVVANPEQEQGQDAFDMFADDDENAHPIPAFEGNDVGPGPNGNDISQPSESGMMHNDYVYDESSGYYYSSSLGYYYDPFSGLYCSAASGLWYSYNEETMTYVEVRENASASS